MNLFVLRHGQAENRAETDMQRELTDRGRADVSRIIRESLDDLGEVTHLWASPYVRAQQTAQIVSELLGDMQIYTTELLVPEASVDALLAQLELSDIASLLLVSHQPLVGQLVDTLCGAEPGANPMGTSSLAAMEADPVAAGLGQLHWLRHAR